MSTRAVGKSVHSDCVLGPATPADGARIEALTRTIWTGRVGTNSAVFLETAGDVSAQIARGGGVLLTHQGTPVGSGRWVPARGPGARGLWIEVKRIGVLPGYTGLGLGALILAALESQGQVAQLQGAQLAVRSDQPRLVAYYAAHGYTLASDVDLSAMNPLEPAPFTLRKTF